jgi:hypothetical protein
VEKAKKCLPLIQPKITSPTTNSAQTFQNPTYDPQLKKATSFQDSPSPEAFLALKIRGGRTRRSGRKKNPALLLILKIM